MAKRNLDAEKRAAVELSKGPGAPFAGKNFADPNIKRSFFEAINKKVYGTSAPFTPSTLNPSTTSTTGQPGDTAISRAPFSKYSRPTEEQFGVTTADQSYKEARDAFNRLALGGTAFKEQEQKTWQERYPEIEQYSEEQAGLMEKFTTTRDRLEQELADKGIVDPRVKDIFINAEMARIQKSLDVNRAQQQQRGATINQFVEKAVDAYGLSISSAQVAAENAYRDYEESFNRYSQQLAEWEKGKTKWEQMAFDPSILAAGVAPEEFLNYSPELRKTWEAASTKTREQEQYERNLAERQLAKSGGGASNKQAIQDDNGRVIGYFNPDTGESVYYEGQDGGQMNEEQYIQQKEQEERMSFAPQKREQVRQEFSLSQPVEYNQKQLTALTKLNENISKNATYSKTTNMRNYANNVIASLSQQSGVGDIAAINQFQKVIDEGAVTRDQDVRLIQESQSFLNTLKTRINKLQKGQQLSEAQRQQIRSAVQSLYTTQVNALSGDPYIQAKRLEAQQYGLREIDTILGELEGFGESTNMSRAPLSSFER